jgi:hypothetical protein
MDPYFAALIFLIGLIAGALLTWAMFAWLLSTYDRRNRP